MFYTGYTKMATSVAKWETASNALDELESSKNCFSIVEASKKLQQHALTIFQKQYMKKPRLENKTNASFVKAMQAVKHVSIIKSVTCPVCGCL